MDMDQDEVVISGVGGHFPECDNLAEFRDALLEEKDILTDNAERWKPGRLGVCSKIGKVSGIERFDATFFGMHRKLTDATDPMSRIIMERVFEAIIDAGINPVELRGTRTAVYIASALSESENIFIQTTAENGFGIMGHNRSMMANRVSYYFDFKGPSFALDSSFSSGLSVLELGKRAIDSGECDMAIVGCATLSFHPEISLHFHDRGYVSPSGFTKPFDKDAEGWVRSEATVCMLLQRKATARRAYASIMHVKVKKFGEDHKTPMLELNPRAYVRLLDEFYSEIRERCGISPEDIDYVEAEGGGFKAWDELEVAVVDEALCSRRSRPLPIGSCKGTVGQTEASSGLVSVCKLLVAMETGIMPATLGYRETNPALRAIIEGRLQVVASKAPFLGSLVALNNFGVTNMFGHAVLKAHPRAKAPLPAPPAPEVTAAEGVEDDARLAKPMPFLVCVSARHEDAIKMALDKLHAMPTADPEFARLMHDVYTSHIFGHLQRGYTFLPKTDDLPYEFSPHGGARRPIWFVYSGMGSQWVGMARHLLRVPVFRAAIEKCHRVLEPHGVDLMHIITTKDASIFDNILHSFVGIAAVQIGLTDVLFALGIKPDGIIGHSVGELGCAYADGCFTAEQMVLAAHARGRASIETELIKGTMAAVGLGYEQIKSMLPETIEVACHNSNTSSTISGPSEDMQRFVAQLKSKEIFAKAVNVSNIAYHSRYIAPAGPKLLSLLRDVVDEPKPRSKRWVSTSVPEARWGEPVALTSSAEYHTNNLLSPVYFEEGSRKIPKDAICIEIAPHGLLQAILKRSLDANVTNIPLTRRDAPDGAVYLLQAIGKMYLSGLNPLLQNLYDPVEYPVSRGTPQLSPLVAWDHSEVWYTGRYCQQEEITPGEKHMPVRSLDPVYAPYRQYEFQGRCIITPAICLEKVLKMIFRVYDEEVPVVFENVQFYRILEMPIEQEALVYVLYQRGSGHFEVSSNMHILARGHAYVPSEGLKKMWVQQPPTLDEGRVIVSQDEVYEELERRGLRVGGKLKGIKQIVVSPSDVQGRVAYHGERMLLLDTLLQVQTLMDSEEHAELRVPKRVQRIILDPCKSWVTTSVTEDTKKGGLQDGDIPEQLEELVFRLHRAAATLRCAGIELRGVTTRKFKLPVDQTSLALDQEQFTAYGDKPALLQCAEEMVSAAVQLASQQVTLQPLCRSNTETVVGILSDGFVNGLDVGALENLLQTVAKRNGSVVVRWVTSHEAAESDLLVADDVDQAGRLLAPHAVLLAVQSPQQPLPGGAELRVLLQQTFGSQRLVLLKKVQPKLPSDVVEVGGVLKDVNLVPKRLTYLVWRTVPEQGIPSLMKDEVRMMSGAHRARCVFLLDPTAPAFSPSHPLYAAQARLGLAASVFLHGSWGNLFHYPRPLQDLGQDQPDRTLPPAHRLTNIPGMEVEFLGLNGAGVEPTNLEQREGHILEIRWPKEERELKGIGLLDYAGTRRSDKRAVMGILDSDTLEVDPVLAWNIPSGWSKEDAATTPYAYAMAYYALVHTASLQPGEKVLVHDGWSAVGQAALNITLAVGGDAYTTYRTEEERSLIQQRYPQIPGSHILSLQAEQFEKDLMRVRCGNRYFIHDEALMDVVLSNLRKDGLTASLRLLAFNGVLLQLNTRDTAEGGKIGMNVFMKSASVYGLSSSCLLRLRADEKQTVHALVQQGLETGVVKPLDRTVLPASHAKQAVSYLDGQCTGKLLLELKATASGVSDGQRFYCQENASYLVVGGDRSHALHTVDWLLARGARIVLLAGQGQAALGQGTLRRLALMRARWGAHVTTVPSVRANTAQGAATLVTRAANMAPLAAVFVLPTFGTRHEDVLLALDAVLRSSGAAPGVVPGAGREAVLMVAVEAGTHSERVAAACAARRQAGGRAVLVSLDVDAPYLRALAMDSALVKPRPVQHVKLQPVDMHRASLKERLGELLPMTEEGLLSLGRAALLRSDCTTSTLLPSSFGGTHVKSREVPPCFLLAGLTSSPTSEMRPLAQHLLANAVLLVPGGAADVEGMAAGVVREMVRQQPAGPYTVVARGWAGCLAMEVAHLLESGRGTGHPERVAVMLLDCAPHYVQEAVRDLGQGVSLQSWVLCSLLHLSPSAYDEIDSLPTWPSRLERALQLAEDLSKPSQDSRAARAAKLEVQRAAIDLVYSRLQALADYKTDFQLHQTVITLIRPPGSEPDNFWGLEKVSTYPVQTSVSTSAAGTPQFWQHAARMVSQGLYIGSKPMHLRLESMTLNSDMLWQRLR